jgi:hypothetical protein
MSRVGESGDACEARFPSHHDSWQRTNRRTWPVPDACNEGADDRRCEELGRHTSTRHGVWVAHYMGLPILPFGSLICSEASRRSGNCAKANALHPRCTFPALPSRPINRSVVRSVPLLNIFTAARQRTPYLQTLLGVRFVG